jgi:hypothetical protein
VQEANQEEAMTPNTVETHHSLRTSLAIAAIVLLVVLAVIVAQSAGPANTQFASAAAVLAIVTLVAVGIERVIEIGWTILGQLNRFGAWWPVNQVTNRAKELETELNSELAGLIQGANKILDQSGKLVDNADQLVNASDKWILEAMKRLQEIQAYAPGNQRVNLMAADAQALLNQITLKRPDLQQKLGVATQTIDGLLDFVAAFKENPTRRLISLYVGMLLGLIVASFLKMDLFCAANAADAASSAAQCAARGLSVTGPGINLEILKYWSVALTGLLIGLGSNPTHEVIKYIQESKKNRQALNGPSVIETTEIEEVEAEEPAAVAPVIPGVSRERERPRAPRPVQRTTRTLFLR